MDCATQSTPRTRPPDMETVGEETLVLVGMGECLWRCSGEDVLLGVVEGGPRLRTCGRRRHSAVGTTKGRNSSCR